MDFVRFLLERRSELAAMTAEHVVLVFVATGLAVVVGVPVGVFLTRRPALARPVIGFASVMQTVPSLALFGFLIPIPILGGIGNRTAIVALLLYALLPILRNTYTGVLSVDRAIVDAGRGMGMTDFELLRFVEVPLALPMVIAGVRIATVVSVGLATIAAAIGAGGLGNYIFRGLSMVDHRLILAGAIPAALLAIGADALLGSLERKLVRER
jgi:osmoprotectant transport system permease protein